MQLSSANYADAKKKIEDAESNGNSIAAAKLAKHHHQKEIQEGLGSANKQRNMNWSSAVR